MRTAVMIGAIILAVRSDVPSGVLRLTGARSAWMLRT
jgi:hypothetical protein